MKVLIKLLLVSAYAVISATCIEYTEHHVKIGDPWKIDCHNPFDEPASWLFISGLPFYNYYMYLQGKFAELVKNRYNLTISSDKRTNTLEVSNTDKYHAGYYGCFPDPTTFDNRKHVKLVLIDDSVIELMYDKSKNIILTMSISFVGDETPAPVFECSFSYGNKTMDETKCDLSKQRFSTCTLQKHFKLDEDVPSRCFIIFKNKSYKIWKNQSLVIKNIDHQLVFVEEGNSWNASCETLFTLPMKWMFDSAISQRHDISLYSHWKINKEYIGRYEFTNSVDMKIYNILIPKVDVNHAGTYMCTHKSSYHLIEKKIELVVIEKSLIKFHPINVNNVNEQSLLMAISYVGHDVPTPHFKCFLNSDLILMDNRLCKSTTGNEAITKCQLVELYKFGDILPNKCEIWFGNYLWMENVLIVKMLRSEDELDVITPTNIYVPLVLTICALLAVNIGLFCKMYSHNKKPSNTLQRCFSDKSGGYKNGIVLSDRQDGKQKEHDVKNAKTYTLKRYIGPEKPLNSVL